MRRTLAVSVLAIVLILQAGCGTVMNFWPRVDSGQRAEIGQMRVYGGVRIDAQTLSEAAWPWQKLLTLLVLAVEFPLSLVMDTVTLPVTIPVTLSK